MKSDHDAPARRLERLSRLRDFDIGRKEPDPRGWTVVNRDGNTVGEVKDLVVDTDRMTATYLDVELDTKKFDLRDDDPHVLVPVERARTDGKRVVVDDISSTWVSELRAARDEYHRDFWDRWWNQSDRHDPGPAVRDVRATHPQDLNRVLDDVRPGEAVRIPVVEEEIVVERRPVMRDDRVVGRAPDEMPPRRER
jgi:sporulation protein YlmC with PRC-barrel domain